MSFEEKKVQQAAWTIAAGCNRNPSLLRLAMQRAAFFYDYPQSYPWRSLVMLTKEASTRKTFLILPSDRFFAALNNSSSSYRPTNDKLQNLSIIEWFHTQCDGYSG